MIVNKFDFEIILVSNPQYKELVAEIFYEKKFLVLINQDLGLDNLMLEFPDMSIDQNLILREIELTLFEEVIAMAKEHLRR